MVKDVILDFVNYNKSISDFRDRTNDDYQDGKEVIPAMLDKLQESKYNTQIAQDLAEILQLSDNNEIIAQFELSDIGLLYDSLRSTNKDDLDLLLESGYFEFSVMDNAVKAKEILTGGIERARKKMEELTLLLKKVDEELG